MNICVGSILTPCKILYMIFLTFLLLHLCHNTSTNLIMEVSMDPVYENQAGRVVKMFEASSNR